MSTAVGCFEDVFGLSRTGCDCFTSDMPSGADTSQSGLFLDETPGLNLTRIFAGQGCEDTGWEILEKAKVHGVQAFRDRVLSQVRVSTKWKRQPVRAQIGDTKGGTGTVTLPKTYHGLELVLADHVGGTATIKRIGAYVKFTGSIDVNVYEEGNDTPIETFTVSTVANKVTWTDITPLELDMDGAGAGRKSYHFLFEPTGGQQALNSRIHCGCTGTPSWNSGNPWFNSSIHGKGQEWYKWAMSMGTYGDDLSTREDWAHNNATQGLLLDMDFKCDARTVVCYGEPDYQQDPVQQAFAWGARFEAALYLVEFLSGSTKVNRESLAGGDELEKLRISYMSKAKEYSEYMRDVLTQEGDDQNPRSGVNTYSDCFACLDSTGIKVSTMRR